METEIIEKNSKRKTWMYVSVSLLILFMIYYAVMMLLSPAAKIKQINTEFDYKQSEAFKTDNRIITDSAFISLNREKAYYQARDIIAGSDSIGLALNLADSTAILELNGVTLHKTKFSEISSSKVLSKANEFSVTSMLAIPLTIGNDNATIMKEPVMLKVAPKDTSEYKPDIVPDTASTEAVNFIFEMENGIRLYVCQNSTEDKGGGMDRFIFDLSDRLRNLRDNLRSIIMFKVPEYHPYIKIGMAGTEVKILYRALPKHGQVALFR